MTGNLDVALALAAAGLSVFPCKGTAGDEGKVPLVAWRGDSTTDPDKIGRMWARFPRAVPAIDVGKSGLLVIDADAPKKDGDPDGVAWFEALALDNGADAFPFVMSKTPSGGVHYIFWQPAGDPIGNGRGGLPKKKDCGVDVRGAGGYIIAPGAVMQDGRAYVLAGDLAEIPDAPEWLVSLLRKPASPEPVVQPEPAWSPPPPRKPADDARIRAYVDSALADEAGMVAATPEGGRNNQLNESAFKLGTMVGAGWLPREQARSALARAISGWSDPKKTLGTLDRALDAGAQHPRTALTDGIDLAAMRAFVYPLLKRLEDGTVIDESTGEIIEAPMAGSGSEARAVTVVSAAELASKAAPPQLWHVPGLIPGRTVTLLSGDGGTGKSLLALMLGVATAAEADWLGRTVTPGCCLYVSAEDDIDELHRRVERIAGGLSAAQLADLRIVPLAGQDAVLAAPIGRGGVISPTRLWAALVDLVRQYRPRLLVLDTSADFFAGSENDRAQVRFFVGMLRGLAIEHDAAVLLLSHPSLTGMNSGSGLSGSTAWNNSVRSRLFLSRITIQEGGAISEADPNRRVLRTMKSNYAAAGDEILLRWRDGIFVADDPTPASALAMASQAARLDMVFLDLLTRYLAEGRRLNAMPSPNYAPSVLARDARAGGATRRALEAAMNRLLSAGRIAVVTDGPPSKRRSHIALATDASRFAQREDVADAA